MKLTADQKTTVIAAIQDSAWAIWDTVDPVTKETTDEHWFTDEELSSKRHRFSDPTQLLTQELVP